MAGQKANQLTPKMRVAAEAYQETLSQMEAYKRAYSCARMKDETIRKRASELFRMPAIVAYLATLHADARERHRLTLDGILDGLSCIGCATITDVCQWSEFGVRMVPSDLLSPQTRRAIKKIKQSPEGALEIEMHDPIRAMELIGRHLGMWQDEKDKKGPPPISLVLNLGTSGG